MSQYKIIFTGPSGAGKTTAIGALSDISPIKTDEISTDDTKFKKEKITVAMDYGLIKLNDKEKIHLYGTPGQERFDFMWEILSLGGIGIILLIDNTSKQSFKEIQFFLEKFQPFVREKKVVVGISQMDVSPVPTLTQYHDFLEQQNLELPIFEVDARNRQDIHMLLQILLVSLDPFLNLPG